MFVTSVIEVWLVFEGLCIGYERLTTRKERLLVVYDQLNGSMSVSALAMITCSFLRADAAKQ